MSRLTSDIFTYPGHPDWLGVSVSNQRNADERIPHLLKIPAAVRFLSMEPLLGPVDLRPWLKTDPRPEIGRRILNGTLEVDYSTFAEVYRWQASRIHWIVVGGESGPDAGPMHPDWARSIRDQCRGSGVPFRFEGWGEWVHLDQSKPCREARDNGFNPGFHTFRCDHCEAAIASGDIYSPRPCECRSVYKFGRQMTGRLLDGVIHDAFPSPGGQS